MIGPIPLPQGWLFNFSCGIAGNFRKNDLSGPLIPGQIHAERLNFLLRTMHPLFHLNHSAADLSQPFIRQTNDRHILDLIVGPEEILNLYRVDVLPPLTTTSFFRSTRK